MKNIVLLILIFCSFSVVGQENTTTRDSITNLSNEKWLKHSPGQELVIASTNYYTGLTLQVIGGVLVGLGSISDNVDYNTVNNFLKIFGSGLAITGVGLEISSFKHIKRAGILMDSKNKKQ